MTVALKWLYLLVYTYQVITVYTGRYFFIPFFSFSLPHFFLSLPFPVFLLSFLPLSSLLSHLMPLLLSLFTCLPFLPSLPIFLH